MKLKLSSQVTQKVKTILDVSYNLLAKNNIIREK